MNLIEKYIKAFIDLVKKEDSIELYNEAGLQYELAFYLKQQLGGEYLIQLERNINDIITENCICKPIKKELDIYILHKETGDKYCIELKVPNSYQIPRRMQLTFEDIQFLECLVEKDGFKNGYLLFTSPNKSFWDAPRAKKNIYNYFNGELAEFKTLTDKDVPDFLKKYGKDKGVIHEINKVYHAEWKHLKFQEKEGEWKYFICDILKNSISKTSI